MLEHYRGWNASWSQNERYFASLDSINRSELDPCDQTRFMNLAVMQDYLAVTGQTVF